MNVCDRCKDQSKEATFYLRLDMDPRLKTYISAKSDFDAPVAFAKELNAVQDNRNLCPDCALIVAKVCLGGPLPSVSGSA